MGIRGVSIGTRLKTGEKLGYINGKRSQCSSKTSLLPLTSFVCNTNWYWKTLSVFKWNCDITKNVLTGPRRGLFDSVRVQRRSPKKNWDHIVMALILFSHRFSFVTVRPQRRRRWAIIQKRRNARARLLFKYILYDYYYFRYTRQYNLCYHPEPRGWRRASTRACYTR